MGSYRQFDWLEISIVPDKSDKHSTIYDSYNRERISRKQLPRKTRVKRARKIGLRRNNRRILINLAAPAFRKIKQKRRQTGSGLGGDLTKMEIQMGSKALNSSIGRKLINKGIDNIPNIFKFGASKIKK